MARVLLVFNAVFGLAPLSVRAASGAASGAVAGGSAPPNDWFAALAETWALSSGSEAQQTVGLERLEQSLLQLAQRSHEEPDNSTLAAINNIGDLIREMIGAVLSTNDAIQHHIRQKKDAMVNCTFRLSRINEAHRSFWMRIHAHRWKHLTCKQEEVAIYTQLEHCEQEKSRCMNTTACCAELVQPNKYCLNPGVGPSPLQFQAGCQTTSRCKEESVTSKLSFFKEKIHELDLAEKACEDSRKGCQDYYSCTTQQTVWKMQTCGSHRLWAGPAGHIACGSRTCGSHRLWGGPAGRIACRHSYCNLNQTAFEEAWCHYAAQVEAEFEGFAVCFDHRRTNYLQYETEQKAQLVIRQQEWRALVRIRCFTRAFEHAFQKSGRFEEMSKHPGEVEHCHWPLPQIPAAVSPILMGSWQRAIQ